MKKATKKKLTSKVEIEESAAPKRDQEAASYATITPEESTNLINASDSVIESTPVQTIPKTTYSLEETVALMLGVYDHRNFPKTPYRYDYSIGE